MLPLYAIIFAHLVFLSACSSALTVQVDIYDSKGLSSHDAVQSALEREGARHVYLAKSGQYLNAAADIKFQLANYLKFLSSPEIGLIKLEQSSKSQLAASTLVEETITAAVQTRDMALQDLRRAELTEKPDDKKAFLATASTRFTTASNNLNELRSSIFKPYQGALKDYLASIKSAAMPDTAKLDRITSMQIISESAVEKNLQSLTGGLDLLDDPLAPVIIAAPPQYWKGVYNKTTAGGTIGNTDIAIKMETIGTFTIKGLRLDASKVTEATFDVIKQSVRMVAAAYGIPLPADQTSTKSGDTGSPTDMVLSIDQVRQAAERKRLLSRAAALTILDLIVTQKDKLVSDGNRKAAVQQLKKSFEAYKTQLSGA